MRDDNGSDGSSKRGAGIVPVDSARKAWVSPRLVHMGSVSQVTAKIDNIGKNDGGGGAKKRT